MLFLGTSGNTYIILLGSFCSSAHLIGDSPYPLIVSLHLFFLSSSVLMWFKWSCLFYTFLGLLSILFLVSLWFKDISLEGLSGNHNFIVQEGLLYAFVLFIFSEVIFFSSVFWVFFDASLSPSIELGCVWPPYGLVSPNYLGVPLLGTVVLLISGVLASLSHSQILSGFSAAWSLFSCILLSFLFIYLQGYEYYWLPFDISDGIYGSIFFFSTGFHGLHVILGSLFLIICLARLNIIHFSSLHHVGFVCALIYWHFVDVVWIGLYLAVYWWGS